MTDDIPPVPSHGFATPAEVEALRATIAGLEARVEALMWAMIEHNDLMRSAFQIAEREGVNGMVASTNWDAFYNRVAVLLKKHHQTCNQARAALSQKDTPDAR